MRKASRHSRPRVSCELCGGLAWRRHLGDDVVLYTTDPPQITVRGSLYGGDVYTCASTTFLIPISAPEAVVGRRGGQMGRGGGGARRRLRQPHF